jgi:hypothetical protein
MAMVEQRSSVQDKDRREEDLHKMRERRSAAKDSRACPLPRTHGGTTHGSSYRYPPQHRPGPVGRPRRDSVGHAIIASVGAGGMGQGHETRSSRRSNASDPQRAGTTVHFRFPNPG